MKSVGPYIVASNSADNVGVTICVAPVSEILGLNITYNMHACTNAACKVE